uniref:Drug resistance transporter n=1 Tax=Verrucosispora sp. TaxID=1871626 RepID=A0A894JN81_9ACTN|nr:drug resistance transporter [Verrucosispora sp.]
MVDAAPQPARSRWLAFGVLCSVQLMVIIDTSIVNVALKSIQEDLGFSQADLAWVVNAYTISFGGLLLLSGRLGDVFGRKRVFMTGLIVFTVASMLCGVANSQEMLIAARFLQGGGAAMAAAVVMGIVITIFREDRERGQAIAAFSFVAAAGGSIGVLAGGILTEGISWHWVFFINAPIGALAVALAVPLIISDRGLGVKAGADLLGAFLVTAGLMLGVYTIVKVGEYGWGSSHTLGLGALSVALLAGFVIRQKRAANPLVPLSLFRSRIVSGANLVQVTMTIGLFGFNFLGALYLQRVLGYTPVGASFAFLPIAVVLAVVSLGLSARLNVRFGPRNVLLAGLALIAAALLLAARAPVNAEYLVDVLPMAVFLGAGAGLAMPAVMTLAMSTATPQTAGVASGLASTSGMAGGTIGLAVLATVADVRARNLVGEGTDPIGALNDGFHLAFATSAVVLVIGIVLALVMLRSAPAPQGPPGPPPGETADAHGADGTPSQTAEATSGGRREVSHGD